MRDFLNAVRVLLLDLASTVFFVILFFLTHNTILSVGVGMAFGLAQIAVQFVRRKPIDTMEWLSLFLVIAAGTATLLTDDPRFVLLKPSAIYLVVGLVMLKRGWLNRYLPEIVRVVAPDVAVNVGFVWAGLMFVSAAVNAFVAVALSLHSWAVIMPIYGIVSKLAVFVFTFLAIRITVVRRVRAMPADERDALLIATGRRAQVPSVAGSA